MISEACVIYMIEIHSPIETNTITQNNLDIHIFVFINQAKQFAKFYPMTLLTYIITLKL